MSQIEPSPKPGYGRKQSFLTEQQHCQGFGEVAGGTTAAFAALCCCPCGLVHLAALAFVQLPAGLCKKTMKKIRRKLKTKKRVQDKPANDKEETLCEGSSAVLSRDELLSLSDAFNLAKVQIAVTRINAEECWEEVTGKSYVGFWRNHSVRDQ